MIVILILKPFRFLFIYKIKYNCFFNFRPNQQLYEKQLFDYFIVSLSIFQKLKNNY